ncbi:MAG: hypothetical protein ACI4JZ_07745, partial [Oscillospiraceae bacterium]
LSSGFNVARNEFSPIFRRTFNVAAKSARGAGLRCSRIKFVDICLLVVERSMLPEIRSGSRFAMLENRVRGNLLACCRVGSTLPQIRSESGFEMLENRVRGNLLACCRAFNVARNEFSPIFRRTFNVAAKSARGAGSRG